MEIIVKGFNMQTSIGTYSTCSDLPCGCNCYCDENVCWPYGVFRDKTCMYYGR